VANIIPVRNLTLRKVDDAVSLASSFESQNIMDFKEMNVGFIQLIFDGQGASDGKFFLDVSLLCDPATFIRLPDSEKDMAGCDSVAYSLCNFAWRYARIVYEAGGTAQGTVTTWARAKRT
jgi:hypothetical protein